MSNQLPLLQLLDLQKKLGNVAALDGVTVDLPSGELVGLIGPNGAGKTTLLKCLAGHLSPDRGLMVLDGHAFHPRNPGAARAAGIRLVEQELALFPSLSVAQNWELITRSPLRPHDSSAESIVAIDWSNPVDSLEAAAAQRLLLSAALSGKARVLMFDEPTALLDEYSARSFLETLKCGKGGRTCLIATHRLNDLSHLDRWLFLQQGRIVLDTRMWKEAKAFFLSSGKRLAKGPASESAIGESYEVEVGTETFPPVRIPLKGGSIVGLTAASASPLFTVARKLVRKLREAGVTVSYLGPERQSDHLFSELSVGDHLSLGLGRGTTGSNDSHNVIELLHAVGLEVTESFKRRPIRTLSGGMQQKLFVAIACGRSADVRILCDPLRGVDLASASVIVEKFQSLKNNGDAMAVVTQDAELLLDCCDPIVIMAPNASPTVLPAQEIGTAGELVRQL